MRLLKKVSIHTIAIILFILIVASPLARASEEAASRHNERGIQKLNIKDFRGAIIEFKEALRYLPSEKTIKANIAAAYNNYGFSLMKSGDTKNAIFQFEQALYYDSENPYTLYNAAQANYLSQNIEKTKEYLEKAQKIDPTIKGLSELLEKVDSEEKVEKDFERNETMHFIMASSSDVPIEKTSYVRIYLEEAYGNIGMFLDHYPDRKTVVLLFSGENYDKLLRNKPYWTMGIYDGKVRIPVEKFKHTDENIITIIYHEYAHAVIYDLVGDKCPLWISEGIASKAETFAKKKNDVLIKKYLRRFGIIPFYNIPEKFTSIDNKHIATLLYVESYLFVEFIINRRGYSGLRDLLLRLRGGENYITALSAIFGEDAPNIQKEWTIFVKEQYGLSKLEEYSE